MASHRYLRIVPRWPTPMGGRFRAARLSLGALTALSLPAAALAATLNVNSTADEEIARNGQCTLREAIWNANYDSDGTAGDCPAGSGADLINVPAGTYMLAGVLDIESDLTLRGAGAATTALVQTTANTDVVSIRPTYGWETVVVERLRVTGTRYALFSTGSALIVSEIISDSGAINVSQGSLLVRRSAVTSGIGGFNSFIRVEGSTIATALSNWGTDYFFYYGYGPVDVSNSTIRGRVFAAASLKGTLLDNPDGDNCYEDYDLGWPPIQSGGHNLDSDGSCGLSDPTDLSNVDPLLGPLQSNGGPTPTHALQLGSPAIDAIPSAACTWDHDGDPGTPEVALTKDQRGAVRPREGDNSAPSGCDIGAYEVAPCADGLDNDGDGLVDFDGGATAGLTPLASPDPTCTSALGATEVVAAPSPGCGIGPELLLLGPLLAAARRRHSPAAAALDGKPDTRARPFSSALATTARQSHS